MSSSSILTSHLKRLVTSLIVFNRKLTMRERRDWHGEDAEETALLDNPCFIAQQEMPQSFPLKVDPSPKPATFYFLAGG